MSVLPPNNRVHNNESGDNEMFAPHKLAPIDEKTAVDPDTFAQEIAN
jgi:hypothetical protein